MKHTNETIISFITPATPDNVPPLLTP